jgi:hypothetical protein
MLEQIVFSRLDCFIQMESCFFCVPKTRKTENCGLKQSIQFWKANELLREVFLFISSSFAAF